MKEKDDFLETVLKVFDQEEAKLNSAFIVKHNIPINTATDDFPSMVQVGVVNVCNLNCAECCYGVYISRPEYRPVFMSHDIFRKIVDEVKEFPLSTVLRFLGKGESFMHPSFIELTQIAKKELKQAVALITNGIALNANLSHQLLDTGIDVIDVSLDAFTAETYGKVRNRSERFKGLVQSINDMIEIRNKNGYKTNIFVSFLIQPENYRELEKFKAYWEPKVDKILFRKYHTYGGKIAKKPNPYRDRIPCPALWSRININEKGLITQCFVDWYDEFVLADLDQSDVSILSVWRGEAFRKIRSVHLKGSYNGLCRDCEGWTTAHWTLSYEQVMRMMGGINE
ncbi:MAG: radical SAM protein [bacterium]